MAMRLMAANERTFLSWLRLSVILAIVGIGICPRDESSPSSRRGKLFVEPWITESYLSEIPSTSGDIISYHKAGY
jgi:hypothetical protein